MGGSQCHHENRPSANFCDECGSPSLQFQPQPPLGHSAGHPHQRRRRSLTRRREIAAAIGVVLAGAAAITAIVASSPPWQRIIASWRASARGDTIGGEPVAHPSVRVPAVTGISPETVRPDGLEQQQAASVPSAIAARLAPAPSRPVPVTPARAEDSPRPAEGAPSGTLSDTAHVMASLLISQLGQDPAWRTALANADAQAPDTPEYAYWRRVAAAIRDGGARSRP
jgi:hypothetical protein